MLSVELLPGIGAFCPRHFHPRAASMPCCSGRFFYHGRENGHVLYSGHSCGILQGLSTTSLASESESESQSHSRVRLFAIPWTVAHQAPPSMEFSRQEYWSGLPFLGSLKSTLGTTLCSRDPSVQFNSFAQSCPTLCDPMNRSTPGLPVHHQLPDFTQTHVH